MTGYNHDHPGAYLLGLFVFVLLGFILFALIKDWGLGINRDWKDENDCAVEYLLALQHEEPVPECWLKIQREAEQ